MMLKDKIWIDEFNKLWMKCDILYYSVAMKLGLSGAAFWILYVLQDTQHIHCQSDICDTASMSRQTIHSAMKKLENDGFLMLERIDGKKGKSIHLTEKGRQFVQKYIAPVRAAEKRVCSQFSSEDCETFFGVFHALTDGLEKEFDQIIQEETE